MCVAHQRVNFVARGSGERTTIVSTQPRARRRFVTLKISEYLIESTHVNPETVDAGPAANLLPLGLTKTISADFERFKFRLFLVPKCQCY